MFVDGDYVISWWNLIVITISAIAAINYARITLIGKVDRNNRPEGVKNKSKSGPNT